MAAIKTPMTVHWRLSICKKKSEHLRSFKETIETLTRAHVEELGHLFHDRVQARLGRVHLLAQFAEQRRLVVQLAVHRLADVLECAHTTRDQLETPLLLIVQLL